MGKELEGGNQEIGGGLSDGTLAVKPLQGAGASTGDRLELLLCLFVDLDINFLAKFRNLYSFPVT